MYCLFTSPQEKEYYTARFLNADTFERSCIVPAKGKHISLRVGHPWDEGAIPGWLTSPRRVEWHASSLRWQLSGPYCD